MRLYKKLLKRIENGEPIYDNIEFAKDLEAIAIKHFLDLPKESRREIVRAGSNGTQTGI